MKRNTGLISAFLVAVCLFCSVPVQGNAAGDIGVLALPVLGYSTDEQVVMGIMSGFSRGEGSTLYLTGYYATAGRYVLKTNGEQGFGNGILTSDIALRYVLRKLYTEGSDPEEYARAYMGRVLLNLAYLKPIREESALQVGPAVKMNHTWVNDVRSPEDDPLPVLPGRFGQGGYALGGFQTRYITTSSLRPVKGWILKGGLYFGTAYGEQLDRARTDIHGDLSLAGVTPFLSHFRVYGRVQSGFQLESPEPVQLFLGGESTLRGQADQRDWGRRQLAGRLQLHWVMFQNVSWPIDLVHSIWSGFPTPADRFDLEVVGFHDIGAVGDPAIGWQRTRLGYGTGLRVVFPPELVFRFDVGYSRDFGFMVYVGAGETL